MNEIGIVVARYHEDLKWISKIKIPSHIYIYNRHEDKNNIGDLNNIPIQLGVNIDIINMEDDNGYEASVYFAHCYRNYNSLNNFIVFLQGNPIEHLHDISYWLNDIYKLTHTHYTGVQIREGIARPKKEIIKKCIEFEYLSEAWAWNHIHHDHSWYPWKDDFSKRPTNEFCPCKTLPTGEIEIKGENKGFGWNFGAGCHFIVSKNRILNHPRNYYKQLQQFVINYIDPNPLPDAIWPNGKSRLYYGENLMETIWEFIF